MAGAKRRRLAGLLRKEKFPDSELSVGTHLQTLRPDLQIWDVIGPARALFDQLSPEITKHLEKFGGSFYGEVRWTLCMVGRSKTTARPTIVFLSPEAGPRKAVKEEIKSSRILENFPGFVTMDCNRPPGFAEVVSMGSKDDDVGTAVLNRNPTSHRNTNITYQRNMNGTKITSVGDATTDHQRRATVGGILRCGADFFIMTVAHIFPGYVQDVFPSTAVPSDFEYEFDAWSDDDYDDDDSDDIDVNMGDKELEQMSEASMSPPSSDSGEVTFFWDRTQSSREAKRPRHALEPRSSCSTSGNSNQITESFTTSNTSAGVREPLAEATYMDETDGSRYSVPIMNSQISKLTEDFSRTVGLKDEYTVHITSQPILSTDSQGQYLDYALLPASNSLLHDAFHWAFSTEFAPLPSLIGSRPRTTIGVIAITASSGRMAGQLLATPTLMKRGHSQDHQEFWTLNLQGSLAWGDSGSWVQDAKTGEVYGHLIAGSPGTGFGYVVPMIDVLADLTRRFQGDWQIFQEVPKIMSKLEEVSTTLRVKKERTSDAEEASVMLKATREPNIKSIGLDLDDKPLKDRIAPVQIPHSSDKIISALDSLPTFRQTPKSFLKNNERFKKARSTEPKARRVKCDEQKPDCLRCERFGRVCDGYDRLQIRKLLQLQPRIPSLSIHKPSISLHQNETEHRYFEIFRTRVASELSGFYEDSFWHRLVLEESHKHEAIRFALIALGVLSESIHNIPLTDLKVNIIEDMDREHHTHALQNYSQAIRSLNYYLSTSDSPQSRIVLIACLLFIACETSQGGLASSVLHSYGALKILRSYYSKSSSRSSITLDRDLRRKAIIPELLTTNREVKPPSAMEPQSKLLQNDQFIDDCIIQCIARLCGQTMFFGMAPRIPPLAWDVYSNWHLEIPATFSNFQEAQRCWDFFMDRVLQFYRRTLFDSYYQPENSQPWEEIERLYDFYITQLEAFEAAFKSILDDAIALDGSANNPPALVICLYQKVTLIMLGRIVNDSEMVYDNYLQQFKDIISTASRIIDSQETIGPKSSRFSFNISVVPPLHVTATRCRDPAVRRQAIALLFKSPRQEGIWDGIISARIGDWLVRQEEEGITPPNKSPGLDAVFDRGSQSGLVPGNLEFSTLTKGWLVPLKNRFELVGLDLHIQNRNIAIRCQRVVRDKDGKHQQMLAVIYW